MWRSSFLTILLFLIKIRMALGGHACSWWPSTIPGVFDIENCKNPKLILGKREIRVNLKEVKAYNNSIVSIDNDTFCGAYNLKTIDLIQNVLEDIQVGAFVDQAKLTHLYLSGNRLKSLEVGTFDPLKDIRNIDLHGNQISVLEDETFVKNLYLKEVNLDFNKIFAIGTNAFSWEKLDKLQLKENMCVDFDISFADITIDRIKYLKQEFFCLDIYESHVTILRERTDSLSVAANDCTTSKATIQTKYEVCKNELTISKKAQCPKRTAKTNSHEILLGNCKNDLNEMNQNLTSCLNEKSKLVKAVEPLNSTDTLEGSLAGKIIDLFGPDATLLIFIGIIVLQTIIITLFVITKFYRKRSNSSNNQPQIPETINLNLAEYAQPRDFFRVSTDSHLYAEVGNGLKKGEPVYAEVDKSKR